MAEGGNSFARLGEKEKGENTKGRGLTLDWSSIEKKKEVSKLRKYADVSPCRLKLGRFKITPVGPAIINWS